MHTLAEPKHRAGGSNDVSEREFQLERAGQWDKGTSCETFNPFGPWLVTTDDAARLGGERAALEARQPSGRLVTPQEVAAAVLHLAGTSAGATTGTWLAVDGGMAGLRLRPPVSAGGAG